MGVDFYFENQNAGGGQASAFRSALSKIRRMLKKKSHLTPTEQQILHITENANMQAHWMWKDKDD